MHVGILGGTGPLGRGLTLRLADGGCTVMVGSRDAGRAADLAGELAAAWPERSLDIEGRANAEVAECDVVIVATPWEAALPTVVPLADALAGSVVVSVCNALVLEGREMHALIPARGSVAEAVQAALPRSPVAAAGHHLPAASLAKLDEPLEADVLVCADRSAAADVTMDVFATIAGLRPLNAGSLASAGAIEAFTAVLITLNRRYRAHSTLRLSGLDHVG
jgi:8-hydroxy-5-deazaflavin:NADPH oxidoreductase